MHEYEDIQIPVVVHLDLGSGSLNLQTTTYLSVFTLKCEVPCFSK